MTERLGQHTPKAAHTRKDHLETMTQTRSEQQSGTMMETKRAQILHGAGLIFIEHGYAGASMSQIAQAAGVSKGALYNHFESKADLFTAFFEEMSHTRLSALEAVACNSTLSVRDTLFQMAQAIIQLMLDPTSVGLYRIILLDAPRFPHLVDTFWTYGFGRMSANLSRWLEHQTAQETLSIDDPSLAAEQFMMMCQTRIVQRHRLSLPVESTPAHIEHIAQLTADSFMRIYDPKR